MLSLFLSWKKYYETFACQPNHMSCFFVTFFLDANGVTLNEVECHFHLMKGGVLLLVAVYCARFGVDEKQVRRYGREVKAETRREERKKKIERF